MNMKTIRNKIVSNKIVQWTYDQKNHIEIGMTEVNFFTGKLTLLMSISYLAEKYLGISITGFQMLIVIFSGLFSFWLLGYTWKKLGLFDSERISEVNMHPVSKITWQAAEIIIKNEEQRLNNESLQKG